MNLYIFSIYVFFSVLSRGILSERVVEPLGVIVHDCGSKVGSVTAVSVTGCSDKSPVCLLKKPANVTIDITFITKKDVSSVTAKVHGIIAGVPVPWPLPHPQACGDILQCPLKSNTRYDYQDVMEVKSSYPSISLIVKWELQDENNDDIVCIQLHARLTSAVPDIRNASIIPKNGTDYVLSFE